MTDWRQSKGQLQVHCCTHRRPWWSRWHNCSIKTRSFANKSAFSSMRLGSYRFQIRSFQPQYYCDRFVVCYYQTPIINTTKPSWLVASEDNKLRLWNIPDDGITEDVSEPVAILSCKSIARQASKLQRKNG